MSGDGDGRRGTLLGSAVRDGRRLVESKLRDRRPRATNRATVGDEAVGPSGAQSERVLTDVVVDRGTGAVKAGRAVDNSRSSGRGGNSRHDGGLAAV